MKKFKWSILLFIILALVLSTGTSYLALNQKFKKAEEKSTPKMAVALVNEDQGATFEGNKIAFGDQFIKNVGKNNNQEWYVVSRGVAENGLKNNNYNMMIVIPNDFSKKAVSIDSEFPEKLTLSYKVNATGNEDLKAEAENTASSILEDFNRRIIDVYFASIIGQLQGAQDNIGKIVNKEQANMKAYKTDVHSPLANYTNQFKTVQDYTGVSVNSFKGFQDVLNRFEQTIDEGAKSNMSYLNGFGDFQKTQTNNNLLANNFSNQLNQFTSEINTEDVLKQLSALELANKVISNQFNLVDNQPNILADATAIQTYLTDVTSQIRDYDTELAEKLQADIEKTINEKLKKSMSKDGQQEVYVNTLMDQPDKQIKKKIESLINQLASMNMEEIDQLAIPDDTKLQLKNVIQVTDQYNKENDFIYEGTNDIPLASTIKNMKESLATDGLIFKDTEKTPKMDSTQTFTLNIPDGFGLYADTGALVIDDKDYTEEFLGNGTVTLPARDEGDLTVSVHVKLLDANADIDVFSPVTWKWNLQHNDEKITTPTDPETPPPVDQKVENSKEKNKVIKLVNKAQPVVVPIVQTTDNKTNNGTNEPNKDGDKTPGDGSKEPNKDGETKPGDGSKEPNKDGETKPGEGGETKPGEGGETKPGEGGETKPGEGGETKPGEGGETKPGEGGETKPGEGGETKPGEGGETKPGEGGETKPGEGGETKPGEGGETKPGEGDNNGQTTERTSNQITHQKSESLYPDSSNVLIKDAIQTVQSYQELLSLYQLYYGFDMKEADIKETLEQGTLDAIATEKSLYYMLNKQNVIDMIANLVSSDIHEEVKSDMNELKQKISAYHQLVNQANQNSAHLAEMLNQTTEHANIMNQSLGKYLNTLANWRENSLKLLDEQKTIVGSRDGEQTAILALDSGFKSLLTQSQSLAESSKGNLVVSDGVYKTFDQINNQAKEIQDSGVTIVSKADNLLADFTKKIEDDKSFSKNFTKVLANSRVGERQNENLYQFLANPVQKQNDGTITAGNAFTPYLIVLVCFIVSLFTSYAIANQERKRSQTDEFKEELSMIDLNLPITVVAFGIAIVEGISIGMISGHLLEFSDTRNLIWISFITVIMAAFVFVSTYLLRQVKMIGMFVLLVFLSMYLFLTDAVGMNVNKMSYVGKIREFSPLQYIEGFLNNYISGKNDGHVIFAVLLVIAIAGLIINLFVWHRRWEEKELDDQTVENIS
ncbi:type VII secretion protein EsaA [Bacillus sp. DX4.1]|uniref:type VII secretion protein EsaA n=1 Tax=Bacillus sp. DX4.1 TaxID=3055867 RepID=UPI0025A2D09A|nr:type VII secretion protein EsaA [Bacillus sp. DX4.1]MDM5188340.1 type VII secretion protein EsaA [Bacillus sp. DX4.1]